MCFSLVNVFTDRCAQRICLHVVTFAVLCDECCLTCMNAVLEEIFVSFYEFVSAAQFPQLVLTGYCHCFLWPIVLGSVLSTKKDGYLGS